MAEEKGVAKMAPVPMVLGAEGFDFTFENAWRFAQGLIDGGMAPKGMNNPGAVVGIMQASRELGIPIMFGLSKLTFTGGRIGIMGDLATALIRSKDGLEPGTDFEKVYTGEPSTPSWTCTVTAKRKGQPEPFSASFSVADAKRAGLWGKQGPWSEYPQRMLYYRALGFLCRDHFSDQLMGLAISEEVADYAPPRDVTPTAALPATASDPLFDEPAVEIDPDTGEVIPEHVGREMQEPLL